MALPDNRREFWDIKRRAKDSLDTKTNQSTFIQGIFLGLSDMSPRKVTSDYSGPRSRAKTGLLTCLESQSVGDEATKRP